LFYLLFLYRGRYIIVCSFILGFLHKQKYNFYKKKKFEYFYSKFHTVNKNIDDWEQKKSSFILKHKCVVTYRNY